jgi:hypothetical protein
MIWRGGWWLFLWWVRNFLKKAPEILLATKEEAKKEASRIKPAKENVEA